MMDSEWWMVILYSPLADLEGGGLRGLQSPPPPSYFKIIKESNKTKQKIEDNPLEKEEERKSCMFVKFLCVHALMRVSTNIFLSKFSSSPPPPLKIFWIRACYVKHWQANQDSIRL